MCWPLNKMPIILKKLCVLTILKAMNSKMINMINFEYLVPQNMRECRVSWQLTATKCARVSSIVTEANHYDAACLFRSSFETQDIFED